MTNATYIQVDGRPMRLSNLRKVMYPKAGFTKGELVQYYRNIAPALLPHLRARPLTLKRYPEGVERDYFYEKRCPHHRPKWVPTVRHTDIDYCAVNDLPTLVWVANLGSIELHPPLSHAPKVSRPDFVAFDLDPGAPAGLVECARVALWLRDLLDGLALAAFPKTSGGKGLQVYVPVNSAKSFDETKAFARWIAESMERNHPGAVVSRMAKKLRSAKIFIDWSQNDEHKTTVAVYSLRAGEWPTVSTPLDWAEVEQLARSRNGGRFLFSPAQVLDRIERLGDLFAPVLKMKQKLPGIPRR